ncbi:MAG: hypothetical protein GEU83_20330, partial [Pseudonocardiaceae bacterium]|nr:hypothetical protein [Pseudonocardiaceae bacterium]
MTAPPYVLLYTPEAEDVLQQLANKPQYATKLKKVRKALRFLEQIGPQYPGLHSHEYVSVPAPDGGKLWESYVENKTPSAWRIWWFYGPPVD